jgi:Mce-associated membrane protein
VSERTPTWYDLLGVEPTADADEIRAAWRGAIADLDPTERRFATLNEAAAVLLDPARRSAYDAEVGIEQPQPEAPEPEVDQPAVEQPEVEPVETSEPTPTPESRAPYLVPGWVLACVGVVALAAVILAAVLGTRPAPAHTVQADVQLSSGSKVSQVEESAAAALAAARTDVVPVVTYDYRHLDADKSAAEDVMTDGYRAAYDKLFDKLRASILSTQTAITAKVVDTGIVRASGDRVEVLVLIDRSTTRKASATPMVTQDQVTLTMRKTGDTWLVDNLRTNQIPQ